MQAGLCDEISLVISPIANGSITTPSLFDTKEGLTIDSPVASNLKNVQTMTDNVVWLTYIVNNVC
ncbi:hypothetical protein [Candidatus Enterococcus lowellii]|uniref:hypothetical protein n=1 Tax=Candidatus Enterococcus lowellii TaxID=2230877 RepID=UPI001A9D05AD|nr:hypothetical protein [Enterococcus sp. DIV2402]